MKKELIESKELSTYMDAMNGRNGIVCELRHPNPEHNEPCRIDEIRCKPGVFVGAVDAYIDVTVLEKNEKVCDCRPERILLYRREFEDGDYVMQACGDIVICAGVQNGKYLFHAALYNETGAIEYPDGDAYLYDSVMHGDRLCTEEEMMRINGALQKEGKFFDPVERKLVDSVFKKNPALFEKFKKDWERYKPNADVDADHDDDDDETIMHWDSRAIKLPIPVHSLRGTLKTVHDVVVCIDAYEKRIEELRSMCEEIYDKLKEEQKK